MSKHAHVGTQTKESHTNYQATQALDVVKVLQELTTQMSRLHLEKG